MRNIGTCPTVHQGHTLVDFPDLLFVFRAGKFWAEGGKLATESRKLGLTLDSDHSTTDSNAKRNQPPPPLHFRAGSEVGQSSQEEQTREDPEPQWVGLDRGIDDPGGPQEAHGQHRVEEDGDETTCDTKTRGEDTRVVTTPCGSTKWRAKGKRQVEECDDGDEDHGDPGGSNHHITVDAGRPPSESGPHVVELICPVYGLTYPGFAIYAGMTSRVSGNSTSGWTFTWISWRPIALIGEAISIWPRSSSIPVKRRMPSTTSAAPTDPYS